MPRESLRLSLPASLDIVRDKNQERVLTTKSRQWLMKRDRAPGVHASDLLDPRQAYWKTVDPKPIADRDVPVFVIGHVLHAILEHAVEERELTLQSDTGQRESESLGIVYSPDLLREEPIEIKTSRSFYEPQSLDDVAMYCEQLLIYMAAEQVTTGHLWVLYLNLRDSMNRTAPAFRTYTITVSQQDLDAYAKRCRDIRDQLQQAIDQKDPSPLPLCREWKCSERMCAWWAACQPPGRYKEKPSERIEPNTDRRGRTHPRVVRNRRAS